VLQWLTWPGGVLLCRRATDRHRGQSLGSHGSQLARRMQRVPTGAGSIRVGPSSAGRFVGRPQADDFRHLWQRPILPDRATATATRRWGHFVAVTHFVLLPFHTDCPLSRRIRDTRRVPLIRSRSARRRSRCMYLAVYWGVRRDLLDTSKESSHNAPLMRSFAWLRRGSLARDGGGRERKRTVAATCGFAQVDRLVSSAMSAWAAWPR
jgi:hypothetical protein